MDISSIDRCIVFQVSEKDKKVRFRNFYRLSYSKKAFI